MLDPRYAGNIYEYPIGTHHYCQLIWEDACAGAGK